MKPTIDNPKIKYCKRAKAWCKTYFVESPNNKESKQVIEWSVEKP